MVSRTARLVDLPIEDAELLTAFGLATVEDLLRHYPRRHYERQEVSDFSRLRDGDYVTVQARVARVDRVRAREKWLTKLSLTDGRRTVTATFFNDRWVHRAVARDQYLVVAGTVKSFRGALQFTHPDIAQNDPEDHLDGTLGAVYPASRKVPSWRIRRAVRTLLPLIDFGVDPVPADVLARHELTDEATALRNIHRPVDRPTLAGAMDRLRFEEAFVTQVVLAQRRAEAAKQPARPRPRAAAGLLDAFDARLPFTLTAGQRQVAAEIEADLAGESPMLRLLQGEVGSGKTVVALRAMLTVIDAGGQAALLAPTEVLAQQHARSIAALLGPLAEAGRLGGAEVATRVALLTGSMPATRRRQELLDAASGTAGIVVGTHALLEQHVQFADLGLVVVDEQHRFGVEQRDALRAKAAQPPHVLVMTATPIPRTVAMTVYGDLEISTLRELPGGRLPIETQLVSAPEHPEWVPRAWGRIHEEVAKGHRAYVVCPRIDPGDSDAEPAAINDDEGSQLFADDPWPAAARPPSRAVLSTYDELATGPLSDLRVSMLHGRMAAEDKDATMRGFAAGDIDVLVTTTVIEVGVDVPAATVMVVCDADRFGISQLHQLRGRVGRGSAAGLCLLFTTAPPGTPAYERLDSVAGTLDGFTLARYDLEMRREGDVLGDRQSGRRSSLRLLRLLRDEAVIARARVDATDLVAGDPLLAKHPALAAAAEELAGEGRADYLAKA
jgi:ATP-dependent DNA helicase RecG